MKLFKRLAYATAFCAAATIGSAANAALIVNDWTVDFSSVGGPIVDNVDEIAFSFAPIHAVSSDGGDTYTITGLGVVSSFGNETGTITPLGLNNSYEMTFDFQLVVDASISGNIITFTHLAGADVLSLYIDDLTDGGKANPTTGTGYSDGTLVATFDVQAGNGGVVDLSPLVMDGTDNATFTLSNLITTGVVTHFGADMEEGVTLALTDSNFDLDADGNRTLDTQIGGFGCLPANQFNFCGDEDGSIRLAQEQVPEPGTLALLGISLLGMIGLRRKLS